MDWPRATVLLRWAAAGCISGSGVWLLARVLTHETDWVSIFGKSLFGIAGLITGVLLVAPEIVRWMVSPISRLVDSILLPSEKIDPPVDFTLARFYGQNLRFDEACEEYEKILHYHPNNVEAHLEGIRAAGLAGNEALARKFYQHARRTIPVGNKRHLLEAVYAARHQSLGESSEAETLPEATQEVEPTEESAP